MKNKVFVFIACLLISTGSVIAQETREMDDKNVEVKKADYSMDHKSIDSIMKATYDVISGPKEKVRDWARFEALFHADARLIPTGRNREGVFGARASSPAEYRKGAEPFFEQNGFFEQEIKKEIQRFGNIVHVFSTYEARYKLADEKPFIRGINSFQLLYDGTRWWVMTIYWQQESADNPIPEEFLPAKR